MGLGGFTRLKKFLGIIEDKLIPKLDRNFSNQEKTLIDNFIFSILKKDKDSKISYTNTKIHDDRSGVSEEITKYIDLWEEVVRFTFHKIDFSKKSIENDANMEAWGFKFKPGEKKSRALLGGIIFEGEASVDLFDTGTTGSDNKPAIRNTIRMSIGLEYDSEDFLSEKTLKNLEKEFFNKIRDAIVKPKRK